MRSVEVDDMQLRAMVGQIRTRMVGETRCQEMVQGVCSVKQALRLARC